MNQKEYLEKFNFRVFPCVENGKKPCVKDWLNTARINPNIRGNYGVLASGTPYREGTVVVIDLDNHKGDVESGVDFWYRGTPVFNTFKVETPSGGQHLYFVASDEQLERIRKIGGYKLHDQIDFFWQQNHYIMGVGSTINGKAYSIIDDSEPSLLPEFVFSLLEKHSTKRRIDFQREESIFPQTKLNKYEKELLLREAEGSEALEDYDSWISLMAAFKNSGFDVEDFKRISWQDPKTQMEIEYKWNGLHDCVNSASFGSIVYRIAPYWNRLELRYDKVEDIAIEEAVGMFPHLHKILIGGSVCIIDESSQDKGQPKDYKNALACYQSKQYRIMYPSLNKRSRCIDLIPTDAFPIWWRNAPILQGKICDPSRPFGMVFSNGVQSFNDYESATPRSGEGTTELFWSHIRENVCNGDEECFTYFQHWVWDLIANPLHRNGVAIAISGNQGCGKSIIGNILSICLHPKYVATINNSGQLLDKFDASYKNSILCMLEESTFAGDRKNGIWSKMKDLITSREATIERKGIDTERIQNKLHFLITSNDDYIVPKQQGDRRYFVLHCNDNHRCDFEYFSEMMRQMENGGAYKLMEEAMSHKDEAKSFNYLAIPETEIGTENVLESAPLLMRVLVSKIDEYDPENGTDDMPFWDLKGEILVNSTKLLEILPRKDEYLTPRKVGKLLSEWFGKESESRRIPALPKDKVVKCFVFCSVDELKRYITEHYFHGLNPFV
ncbi:MAG: bifunctional DNA primase/polymerase [Sphaerochaetaceae bacterium]|nr:bifunctional DNA primase/polymerase [Sphaerochaetaceae bacterium]